MVGGFANNNYWSSTENDNNNAWKQNFNNLLLSAMQLSLFSNIETIDIKEGFSLEVRLQNLQILFKNRFENSIITN